MEPHKTGIFQFQMGIQGGVLETDYYRLDTIQNKGFVLLSKVGRLTEKDGNRTWRDSVYPFGPRSRVETYYPYPFCARQRLTKRFTATAGNGRIEGGRIILTRHGGGPSGRTLDFSLAECDLPDEYYT